MTRPNCLQTIPATILVAILLALLATTVAARPAKQSDEDHGERPHSRSLIAPDRLRPRIPSGPVNPRVPVFVVGIPFVGEVEDVSTDSEPGERIVALAAATGTTVKGKLVYDDQRDTGHFDIRRDFSGNEGSAPTTGGANYLGAWFFVADFYELDSVAGSPLHLNCKKEKYLGSATVGASGDYSFSVNETDN